MNREACILCGSTEAFLDFRHEGHNILRCKKCGFSFVDTQESGAPDVTVYSKDYYLGKSEFGDISGYVQTENHHRKDARKILSVIEQYCGKGAARPKNLLDIVCAVGYLLDEAKKTGWQVKGVEISEYAAQYAREHLGLDVFCGELTVAPYSKSEFDVVTMIDGF